MFLFLIKVEELGLTKKNKKRILNLLLLLLIIGGTFYLLLKDQELGAVMSAMERAKKLPLVIGIGLVIFFVCCESFIIHYLMKRLDQGVKLFHCIKYSFIGFFYSAVTPSASGGQPMQIYYMNRDGIGVAPATLVLIIITAVYKAVLLLLGAVAGIMEFKTLKDNLGGVRILLAIGVIANLLFIGFLLMIIFKHSFSKRIIGSFILWCRKHRLLKNTDRILKKLLKLLETYESCADYIKKNSSVFFYVILVTVIQRVSLFFITFLVYKSFGLHGTSVYQIVALQTMIALAIDVIPVPGGIGFSESCFLVLFDKIFGEQLIIPGMLLSRGITYYVLIVISAIITLIAHLTSGQKQIKESGMDK